MLDKLLNLISATAATFVPGVGAAMAAGDAVLDLIRDLRPTLSQADQTVLDAALPDLITKMNRDVDEAMAALRG